jgi:hypothetical protein
MTRVPKAKDLAQAITDVIYMTFQVVKVEDRIQVMEEEALEEVVVPMAVEGALEEGVVILEEHQEIIIPMHVVEEVVHTTVHFKTYIPATDTTVAMAMFK